MTEEMEFMLHSPCSACSHEFIMHYTVTRDWDEYVHHVECYGRDDNGNFCECDWGPLEKCDD